ncbi:MAG: hypothetical protein K2I48_08205, partial [Muribaculaceae bacterium]|nr:hypothetical protein [Muribaculaceae bacterium]
TETRNLLKRLGYNDDDIEEYIWAVAHFDIPITLDQLRESVKFWEKYGIAKYDQLGRKLERVAPKWTEEMEAGDVTPSQFYYRFVDTSYYIPHITTSKTHPYKSGFSFYCLRYSGGLEFKGTPYDTYTTVNLNARQICGIGSITGDILQFSLWGQSYPNNFKYIGKFKSNRLNVNLEGCFAYCYQFTDFSNIDISCAWNFSYFCSMYNTIHKVVLRIPDGTRFPPQEQTSMFQAFYGRWFDGARFEIYYPENIYRRTDTLMFGDTYFSDCVIDYTKPLSPGQTDGWFGMSYAVRGTVNRINIPYLDFLYITSLWDDGYYNSSINYGVWEVNAPMLQRLGSLGYPEDIEGMNVTLFNVGGNCHQPKTNVFPIDKIMRPYYFNSDSFVRGLRSWVSVPADGRPCGVTMLPTQFEVIPEDVIADLSEKGYTISVV